MSNVLSVRACVCSVLSVLISTLSCQFAFAAEGESVIEEVIVTGSYLKRDAANSPSPLSVVTSADIEDLGAADVAEIIQSMPWSSGSQTRASTFQGEGADGRSTVNLRNLGHGSTLPLVNGKRSAASWYNGRGNASVNINALIPTIAIERIEVVKDGASALYGSDAVAGVVNFISKKDFEGMDLRYQFTTDEETGNGDANQLGFIWGVQGDRGSIVASVGYLDRDEINVDDNYKRFGASTISSTGQPGSFTPISGQTVTWAANGLNPGMPVAGNALPRNAAGTSFGSADVNCEDSAALERGGALGVLFNRCIYDYGSFFSIQAKEKLRQLHVDGHYDFTDTLEFYFELAANKSEFDRLNSLNPNAPALAIPTSVNYIDSGGMIQSVANPGSVEDAFRRGIEPLRYANITRLIGGTRDTPRNQRPLDTFTNTDRTDSRYVGGFKYDFQLGDKDWNLDASYTASQHNSATTQVQDTLSTNMELALGGLGGPNCNALTGVPGDGNAAYAASGGSFDAGACYFFNPFGNSLFDRSGGVNQTDLTLVNPAELYGWLAGRASSDEEYDQNVIDIVAAGELFELGDNQVGLAVGFQQRVDKGQSLVDSSLTSDNLDFVYGARDWDGKLTTNAVFAELAIPIGDRLDVNLAIRYEEFDEINEDTTDPKITVLWRPLDSLSLRASAGTSFRVPSLLQSFGSLTTVANQLDLVGGTAFKPSLTVGNPDLTPESADNWGVGGSWIPRDGLFEGLAIDIDYYHYKYKDIITRESSATILSLDNAALAAYGAANVGGSCPTLNDCYIEAVDAGVGNREQVVRNGQAILLRILPNFANANSAEISGIDLNSSYTFDTGIGTWRVGLQAAWLEEYSVEVAGASGAVTVFDAVGNYNSTNPVARPLPEWKINGTLTWSWNNHRAFMIVKYVDGIDSDIPAGTRGFFRGTLRLGGNDDIADDLEDTKIESFTTADLQYTYSFGERWVLNDTQLTLGVMNVTDESPPAIALVTAYDGTLHDGRGRMWFLGIGASL